MSVSTVDYALMAGSAYQSTRGEIYQIPFPQYDEWRKTGNWLDKPEAETRSLLGPKGEGGKPSR
jgi:hypothetical protein